ncbi:BZ3500_MvSof-1268-A1-R1_Chr1-3g02421 [Microbotryum saponariae]|uniref:BZ3500_MvSof-1268-A1-R1_Chr1-3g02421 protein n=1 Tax=Microbotryum saponariae TaxID=289078 RepID=A0A2X0KH64_9BASI|nr:BZ3500_MvSof-1268-A1-R1_Chr1-3g02421 [Microbotryum saponariae]SCZ96208.1 BZ3501_MvSof-1269-A2-R1_Chr1-3g02024 [Microbotryum saponariae]
MISTLLVASVLSALVVASPLQERALPPIFQVPQTAWTQLNASVQGRLARGSPMARSCFLQAGSQVAGSFDANQCATVQQNYEEDIFIADQFGGYATANWGTCQTTGGQRLLDYNLPQNPLAYAAKTCQQGSVPPYYVDVQKPTDVTAVIAFAKKYGVPLVVKNSGHDYKGRSSGPNSLALWTHNIQYITRNKKFIPAGCPTNIPTKDGVTFGAGVPFYKLYQFAEDNNITILGGSARTVGPSGGWIQGGGHGALSNQLGLGVDRALQFKIVMPNGTYVTANKCQNTELFWAIRGGGGSTFGVIMESTTTAAPQVTVQVAYVKFVGTDPNSARNFLAMCVENAIKWAADGWGGYIQPGALSQQGSGFVMFSTILNNDQAKASMKAATDFASQLGNVVINNTVVQRPSFLQAYQEFLFPNDELVNVPAALGSRLIPKTNFQTAASQAQLLDAMMKGSAIVDSNTIGTNSGNAGTLVYGGSPFQILVTNPVNYPNPPDSAVTPAWRNTLWHVLYAPTWNYDGQPVPSAIKANQAAQLLRDITPGSGAYQNEASIMEPDPINTFWGQTNYNRLLKFKKLVDVSFAFCPSNIFTCWQCVGYNANDPRFGCYPRA